MLTTRRATIEDSNLITLHGRAMFADMRNASDAALEEMAHNFEPWVRRMISEDKYAAWVTSHSDRAVASAGLLILDWAPHPLDPTCGHRGYILNVFVEPEFRGRGIAKALTLKCMEEAKRRGIGVIALHASQKGQPVYEKLGFKTSNEMLFVTLAS